MGVLGLRGASLSKVYVRVLEVRVFECQAWREVLNEVGRRTPSLTSRIESPFYAVGFHQAARVLVIIIDC